MDPAVPAGTRPGPVPPEFISAQLETEPLALRARQRPTFHLHQTSAGLLSAALPPGASPGTRTSPTLPSQRPALPSARILSRQFSKNPRRLVSPLALGIFLPRTLRPPPPGETGPDQERLLQTPQRLITAGAGSYTSWHLPAPTVGQSLQQALVWPWSRVYRDFCTREHSGTSTGTPRPGPRSCSGPGRAG